MTPLDSLEDFADPMSAPTLVELSKLAHPELPVKIDAMAVLRA